MSERGGALVERDGELGSALAGLDVIADGGGRVISVEGPPGIGKSALLGAIREGADSRGFQVFVARGSELETDFPFGVVRQLFEGSLRGERRDEALADAAAPAAAVFASGDEPAAGGNVAFAALHGLYWMTQNLAGEDPAVLIVDDLHWCDRPSLRFLAYLAHRLEGTSIGLVTGLRSTDPGIDPGLVADLVGNPSVVTIRPGSLGTDAVGELVAERLGRPPEEQFSEACRRATGGNPLLLRQLLSALELDGAEPVARNAAAISDVGPRAVARTVQQRLSGLPPEATEVARAVAILGDGAELATIAALTGHDVSDVARITGGLANTEILRAGAPLGFVHPLVRAAVYESIPVAERQLQHGRAAKLMLDAGAATEKVAAQLLAAPPSGEPWVAQQLAEAGASASASGATESAVTYLRRMIEEPLEAETKPRVLLQLGLAEAGTDSEAAATHLYEARRTLAEPELVAAATYALARILLFVGRAQEGADMASESLEGLPDHLSDIADMIESVELVSAYFGAEVPDVEERFRKLRELPEEPTGGQSVLAAAASYDWMYRGGSAEECADLASRAMERATLMEVDTGLTWVVANVVRVAADRPEALEFWDQAVARSHEQGSMYGALTAHSWRGFTELRFGDLLGAEESVRAGIEQISLLGGRTLDYAYAVLAYTLLEQGRRDEAEEALHAIPRPQGVGDGALLWRTAEIELMLSAGRDEEALAAATEHERDCGWRTNPAYAPSRSQQARALAQMDRVEEAVELMSTDLERAETWGAPGTVGRSLRIRGEIRQADGLEDLDRAIALLEDSPMRLDLAKALAAQGGVLRRGRKPSEARDPLRRAFELAEVCGAAELATQVRSELHATGVRPRSSALKGPASLTPSETRVTELAAQGRTNKQIAQTLYVTPKTVEVHLSNAYRKLEISSRGELAAALAET